MTILTKKEIIKSFFAALKDAFENGDNWPSGNGFTVYRYDNMRDYRIEPLRPFVFLGSRGVGDEPTWRPCVIMNVSTRKASAELGGKSVLLSVVLNIVARSGGEEEGIAAMLEEALATVAFTNDDGDSEVLVDVEDEWETAPYEVPAAIAMEGSLRNWYTMSANFLIF
jgi:hypothetical protein